MIANATEPRKRNVLDSQTTILRKEYRDSNETKAQRQQRFDLERRAYVDGLRHTD